MVHKKDTVYKNSPNLKKLAQFNKKKLTQRNKPFHNSFIFLEDSLFKHVFPPQQRDELGSYMHKTFACNPLIT